MSVKEDLEAMGFDPKDIERAIANTNGSIEQCVDWIGNHQGEDPAEAIESQQTLEERLADLKARAAKKNAAEEKRLRIERLEIQKRSSEAERAREDLQVAAAKKAAADRKRQATEDRLYREELRRKIEQDKLEREARARELKREHEQATPAAPAASNAPKQAKTGNVRMRVRYEGQTVTKSVDAAMTVEDLGEELASDLGLAPGSFELETSYPKTRVAVVANTQAVSEAGLANASLTVLLS